MKVHWTDTAREHRGAVHAYIARNSPQYALRTVDRLTRRSQQTADFPIKPDQIDVLAVIHSAQQIPPGA